MSLVSVIIPFYNNPQQLRRAVSSVNKQTYTDIEIILVDDGSTSDYTQLIQQLKEESSFKIHYCKKENSGPGLSRQLGLDKAKGTYIQYLDADDELLPHKLQQQIEVLESNPRAVMTYGLSQINNNPQKLHRPRLKRLTEDVLLESVLQVRKWHTSACLWRYPKSQYWEELYNGEDVLHDFNVALRGNKDIIFTETIVANINNDQTVQSLSNVSSDVSKHQRFVLDCINLNQNMYQGLKRNNLLSQKKYANPLAERMFHAAMRVYLVGYTVEAKTLIKLSKQTTHSFIKQLELRILRIMFAFPLKNKRKVFQIFYRMRRTYLRPSVHQYRFI